MPRVQLAPTGPDLDAAVAVAVGLFDAEPAGRRPGDAGVVVTGPRTDVGLPGGPLLRDVPVAPASSAVSGCC